MAEVDFSDLDQATAWFETQSKEKRCAMASRAALRVLANISPLDDPINNDLALVSYRAILTSAGRGLGRSADVGELERAAYFVAHFAGLSARDAADSALSGDSANLSARSAAHSAALSADSAHSADSAYSAHSARSAALSARAAADSALSARSAALSALSEDAKRTASALVQCPLWHNITVPTGILTAQREWLDFLAADPDRAFWRRWYLDMWDGTFRDWDLAIEVALLPNDLWVGEGALAKVAAAIREIEARRAEGSLDQDKLKKHASQLVSFPAIHADFAHSVGRHVSDAITSFKTEAKTNALPNGFEQYETLPGAFEALSRLLQSDADTDAKIAALVAQVNSLHATNLQLRQDLTDARFALSTARLTAIETAQVKSFGEKAQTFLTNVTLVGAIGMSMFQFFGVDENDLKYDALKQQLDDLAQEMQEVKPVLETDPAP